MEQRSEYADWFRKIGTDAQVTLLWFKTALHGHVNSFCVPAWNSALYCESCPDKMRDFFLLSYQASIEASLGARVGCVFIGSYNTCAQMAAVPTLSSRSWPPDGTEDMPAHGCHRLSGALQEVSSL